MSEEKTKKQLRKEYKKSRKEAKIQFKKEKKELKKHYKAKKTASSTDYQNTKNKLKYNLYSTEDDLFGKSKDGKPVERRVMLSFDEIKGKYKVKKLKRPSKRYTKPAPERSLLEEIGNAVTHGVGGILSLVALGFMLAHCETTYEYIAAFVYGIGLFILFTISCLYHAFKTGSKVKNIFRHFDYMSIYLLIGATFAPLLLCFIGGTFGLVFFIVQWVAIATGITLVGVFGPGRLKFIHFPLYFIIGWSGLLLIPKMITTCLPLFFFILGGGILYSVGMIPFALRKKVAHFIWHFFVLFGACAQWVGIYIYIFLP